MILQNRRAMSYPGNVGIHELMDFYQKADETIIREFEEALKTDSGKALRILEQTLGIKLL